MAPKGAVIVQFVVRSKKVLDVVSSSCRSKLEHSVMIKTYIFLMLMLIILPSLTLTRLTIKLSDMVFFLKYC